MDKIEGVTVVGGRGGNRPSRTANNLNVLFWNHKSRRFTHHNKETSKIILGRKLPGENVGSQRVGRIWGEITNKRGGKRHKHNRCENQTSENSILTKVT